jgi:hypothetical protein
MSRSCSFISRSLELNLFLFYKGSRESEEGGRKSEMERELQIFQPYYFKTCVTTIIGGILAIKYLESVYLKLCFCKNGGKQDVSVVHRCENYIS